VDTFVQLHAHHRPDDQISKVGQTGRSHAKPKPFVWKADPKAIIAAAKRGHQVLETIQ